VADVAEGGPTADGLFDELLAICEALEAPEAGAALLPALDADAGRVPVSLLVKAQTPVTRRIERFEDQLARGLAELNFGPAAAPPINATGLQRHTALSVLLVHEWLGALAADRREARLNSPSTIRWLLAQAIDSGAARATNIADRGASLELSVGARVAHPLDVDQPALLQHITGLVGVRSAASAPATRVGVRRTARAAQEPSLALLAAPLLRIEPRRLSPDAIGAAGICTTFDGCEALVTPLNALASVRVGEAGDVDLAHEWPRSIWGAFPVAGTGATYAWHNPDRALLYRAASDAKAVVFAAPFRPLRGAALADGSSIWCAFDGGLWRWQPGTAPIHQVDTPIPIHLHLDGDVVRVDAGTRRVDGTAIRRGITCAWTWRPGDTELGEATLDADAQCTSREADAGWTASAHPYSDVVTISGPDGLSARLACFYPLTLAWAGRSLVICTGEGEVLLFPLLKTRLAEVTR
jgi:hypothetical protein